AGVAIRGDRAWRAGTGPRLCDRVFDDVELGQARRTTSVGGVGVIDGEESGVGLGERGRRGARARARVCGAGVRYFAIRVDAAVGLTTIGDVCVRWRGCALGDARFGLRRGAVERLDSDDVEATCRGEEGCEDR